MTIPLSTVDVLESPLDLDEIKAMISDSDSPTIHGTIILNAEELVCHKQYDDIMSDISLKLTGTYELQDITFKAIGITDDGNIIFDVEGNAEEVIQTLENTCR